MAISFLTEEAAAGNYPSRRHRQRERKLLQTVYNGLTTEALTMASKTLTSPTINGTVTSSADDVLWTLKANDATALKIGSAASPTMLVFDTRTAGTGAQLTTNVELHVADATDSSSITTGALICDGGLGVAKSSFFGDNLNVANEKKLKLFEATGGGSNFTSLKAPAALAADVEYVLPSAQGGALQFLQNDGAGTLSWAAITASSIVTVTGTIAAADVKALNSVPQTLVAAPAAGHIIIVEDIELFLDFGSAPHVRDGGNEELVVQYSGGVDIHAFANATDAFLVSAADARRFIIPTVYNSAAVNFDPATADAEAVQLYVTNSDLGAAGDSPIKYSVRYRDVTLSA